MVSDEPIRLEGLASIFEQPSLEGQASLLPVRGSIQELLIRPALMHLVVDLHSSSAGLKMLGAIARRRPGVRLIVIGPEGNDELVLESILAGARAYLDVTADPGTVREAIEAVTSRLDLGSPAAALEVGWPGWYRRLRSAGQSTSRAAAGEPRSSRS